MACVELNLTFFVRLLAAGDGNLITLCNSQACEKFFRTLRSFATFGSTQINVSTKEVLDKIGKIKLLLDIMFEMRDEIDFAEGGRKDVDHSITHQQEFLDPLEILQIVEPVQLQAEADCAVLGITTVECKMSEWVKHGQDLEALLNDADNEVLQATIPSLDVTLKQVEDLQILTYRNLHFLNEPTMDNIIYKVNLQNLGEKEVITKVKFLVLLNQDGNEKLSVDRRARFITRANEPQLDRQLNQKVEARPEITIGDWICIFDNGYFMGCLTKMGRRSSSKSRMDRVVVDQTILLANEPNATLLLSPIFSLDINTSVLKKLQIDSWFDSQLYEFTIDRSLIDIEDLRMNPEFDEYFVE